MANNAHLELINYLEDKLNEVPLLTMDDYIMLSESKEETIQRYLEDKYSEYNMRVYIDEIPAFGECRFLMSFFVNGLMYKLVHSCMSYRGKIYGSEVGKMIELIEAKINSKIEVETVEVKPKEYKPLKCPCCGGSINSISLCINDDYVKCEYCDTILTSKVKSQEIYLL